MNYIGSHPLNLIGKVAIVTSASNELGAAICRSLLNSNAFVLGIDSEPAHQTTKSTAASHFQFLQCENEEFNKEEVLKKIERFFLKDVMDILVDVVPENEEGRGNSVSDLIKHMEEKGGGIILKVLGQDGRSSEKIPNIFLKLNQSGVRRNVIVPQDVEASSENDANSMDAETQEAMLKHLEEHKTKRQVIKFPEN